MALDRHRILNELGSVMNQLKSADCGCMGKLFGDSGQTPAAASTLPTCGGCRRGCCHGHGYGWNSNGSCGEPYSSNGQNMYGPCMGRCNPPKLYADTYNYLTENLMQPAIKEVYSDLKSLTPTNTVVNNQMAHQMGFSENDIASQGRHGTLGDMSNPYPISNQPTMGNMNTDNNIMGQTSNVGSVPINEANTHMAQMGGMGPQIVNMLGNMTKSNNIMGQNNTTGQSGQLTGPMVIDAPQAPHGQVGVTPLSAPMRNNQNLYNVNSQGYPSGYNANENTKQPNMQYGDNTQNMMNTNPAAQQIAATHPHSSHYHGQHSQGVAKFNEMFPGVMKGLGGNLGFDPMAIAIQMNPANQQQSAINTMNKMMQNNDINKIFDQSANTAAVGVNPTNTSLPNAQQNQIQYNASLNQHSSPLRQTTNESTINPNQMSDQNLESNKNAINNAIVYQNNQQLHPASSGVPMTNQQSHLQLDQQQQQRTLQHQSMLDPNTSLSAVNETEQDQQKVISEHVEPMIMEPIFPADKSRYVPTKPKYYGYNTLGQPVEMLNAKMYRTPEPILPQTLSPQSAVNTRSNPSNYSKVKSTVSKTSLMGNKSLGRTPTQLQQIYNQYKGSQSYTQQNIAAPVINPVSNSEGKLKTPSPVSLQRQVPVEKVGGDTLANNNQFQNLRTNKVGQVIGQIGDVPAGAKPTGDEVTNKVDPINQIDRKCRNGLQDMVYSSYPTSAAWTFHGAHTSPYDTGRRHHRYY